MTCPTCRDRGVVFNPEVVAGEYGQLELCACVLERCRCGGRPSYSYWDEESRSQPCPCRPFRFRLRGTADNLRNASIPPRYRYQFRQAFLDRAPDGTPIARAPKVRAYIEQLVAADEPPRRGLLLHGRPGTGKTLLACIILNELMLHRGRPARHVSLSRDFFHRLRDTFSEESDRHGQAYQILEDLVRVPYVVLDDMGVQRGTEWEEEVLYDLVDGRYADQRFTVVTTNEPLATIEHLSAGRIYSRLLEMCQVVELDGPDWRACE